MPISTVILPNASFKSLTFFAESDNQTVEENLKLTAEIALKRKYPSYLNFKKALGNKQYGALIDNVITRVLPLLPEVEVPLYPRNKNTYHRILLKIGPYLSQLIGSYLFSTHAQNDINPLVAHDLVFHYCQYNTKDAGEMLNKNILYLWNTGNKYLAHYLIEYGADVNALHPKSTHSSLFHALTFNSSADFIRLLIDHGANYSSYREKRHGVQYTLMLLTALNHNQKELTGLNSIPEALTVLMEKFPGEVALTLNTLDTMLEANNSHKYTCESGPYQTMTRENTPKQYYSVEEIRLAKEMVMLSLSQRAEQSSALSATLEAKENNASKEPRKKVLFNLHFEPPKTKGMETPAPDFGRSDVNSPSSP